MSWISPSLVTVLVAALVAALVAPSVSLADDPPPASQPAYGGPCLALRLTPPITKRDVEYFCTVLQADEYQRVFIERCFDKYSPEADAAVRNVIPQLQEAGRRGASAYFLPDGGTIAEDTAAMEVLHIQLKNDIERLDQVLFAMVESVLHESQKPHCERLRLLRQRERADRQLLELPMAGIDLTDILRMLEVDEHDLRAGGGAEAMEEYERTITPVFVEMDQILSDARPRFGKLNVDEMRVKFLPRNDQQSARESLYAVRLSIMAPQARILMEAGEINREFRDRIAAGLPGPLAERFLAEYGLRGYRGKVWPDSLATAETVEALLAHRELTPNEHNAVIQLRESHKARHRTVSEEMELLDDAWRSEYAATRTTTIWFKETFRPAMRHSREARWLLNKNLVERIADVVQAPPDSTAGKAVSEYRNRYETALEAAEADQYPSAL